MSLFGGDDSHPVSSSPGFPDEESDFSIEEINSPSSIQRRSSSYDMSDFDTDFETAPIDDGGNEDHDKALAEINYTQAEDIQDSNLSSSTNSNQGKSRARSWRHYTHADRAIDTSLINNRASDLSVHLYNAHALKARVRDSTTIATVSRYARKSRWIPKYDAKGVKIWYPEVAWTAWPLPPDLVPSPDAVFGSFEAERDGLENFSINRSGDPTTNVGKELQDELEALFLKNAKDMWRTRNFHPLPLDQTGKGESSPQITDDSVMKDISPKSTEQSSSRSSSPQLQSPMAQKQSDRMRTELALARERSAQAEIQSSPPLHNVSLSMTVKNDENHLNENDIEIIISRPVFSADDEHSHRLLAPTVDHIISKLDNLLLALHHHREGQWTRDRDAGDTSDDSRRSRSTSRSRTRTPISKSGRRSSTPAPRERKSRSASNSNTREDIKVVDADPLSSDDDLYRDISSSDSDGEKSRSVRRPASITPNKQSTRRNAKNASPTSSTRGGSHKPVPRDWSEFLGVASLAGWSPAIIARATKRCETLFGETIILRRFPEVGSVEESENEELEPNTAAKFEGDASYRCPFPACKRHGEVFARGFRWREHMSRTHKQSKEQRTRWEETMLREHLQASGKGGLNTYAVGKLRRQKALDHNPKHWVPPYPLKCPYCRNDSVYPRVSRLLGHFNRFHKFDPRIQDAPSDLSIGGRSEENRKRQRRASAMSSDLGPADEDGNAGDREEGDDQASEEDMIGGVHRDGFLQRIYRRGRRVQDSKAARDPTKLQAEASSFA